MKNRTGKGLLMLAFAIVIIVLGSLIPIACSAQSTRAVLITEVDSLMNDVNSQLLDYKDEEPTKFYKLLRSSSFTKAVWDLSIDSRRVDSKVKLIALKRRLESLNESIIKLNKGF